MGASIKCAKETESSEEAFTTTGVELFESTSAANAENRETKLSPILPAGEDPAFTVSGRLVIQMTNGTSFVNDAVGVQAIRKTIAKRAAVPVAFVALVLSIDWNPSVSTRRLLILEDRIAGIRFGTPLRRLTIEGVVLNYLISVPVELVGGDGTAEARAVVGNLSTVTDSDWSHMLGEAVNNAVGVGMYTVSSTIAENPTVENIQAALKSEPKSVGTEDKEFVPQETEITMSAITIIPLAVFAVMNGIIVSLWCRKVCRKPHNCSRQARNANTHSARTDDQVDFSTNGSANGVPGNSQSVDSPAADFSADCNADIKSTSSINPGSNDISLTFSGHSSVLPRIEDEVSANEMDMQRATMQNITCSSPLRANARPGAGHITQDVSPRPHAAINVPGGLSAATNQVVPSAGSGTTARLSGDTAPRNPPSSECRGEASSRYSQATQRAILAAQRRNCSGDLSYNEFGAPENWQDFDGDVFDDQQEFAVEVGLHGKYPLQSDSSWDRVPSSGWRNDVPRHAGRVSRTTKKRQSTRSETLPVTTRSFANARCGAICVGMPGQGAAQFVLAQTPEHCQAQHPAQVAMQRSRSKPTAGIHYDYHCNAFNSPETWQHFEAGTVEHHNPPAPPSKQSPHRYAFGACPRGHSRDGLNCELNELVMPSRSEHERFNEIGMHTKHPLHFGNPLDSRPFATNGERINLPLRHGGGLAVGTGAQDTGHFGPAQNHGCGQASAISFTHGDDAILAERAAHLSDFQMPSEKHRISRA